MGSWFPEIFPTKNLESMASGYEDLMRTAEDQPCEQEKQINKHDHLNQATGPVGTVYSVHMYIII
jgi:hypothetical protein